MNNCRHSCQDAFTVEKDSEIKSSLIHACNKGCDIASNPLPSENLKTDVMKPTQQSKPRSIFDIMFGDDIFSGLEPNDRYMKYILNSMYSDSLLILIFRMIYKFFNKFYH